MRKIFTSYLFLLSFMMSAQLPINLDTSSNNPHKKTSIIRTRCQAQPTSAEPLWIIDGVPVELEKVKNIDSCDIESIAVLKDAAASALYGCRAMNGVIIITTRNSKHREFWIRDFLDGSNVAGATVSFISNRDKKDTLMFATNDSGKITTNKLKSGEEYEVAITSAGYKTLSALYKNTRNAVNHFSLERKVVNCAPVVVTSYGRTIRCGYRVCCILTKDLISEKSNHDKIVSLVYPNPVQRGRTVAIEINSYQDNLLNIKVITIDGRQLLSQAQKAYKGINRVFINMDHRWAGGVYFLQLIDDKGNIKKQEKVVVQ